jgi:hypothetical protein
MRTTTNNNNNNNNKNNNTNGAMLLKVEVVEKENSISRKLELNSDIFVIHFSFK